MIKKLTYTDIAHSLFCLNDIKSAHSNGSIVGHMELLKRHSVLKNEAGLSMLEGAIVMPVLIAILFGIIQWSLILGANLAARNASAMGARLAGLTNATEDDVKTSIINSIAPIVAIDADNIIIEDPYDDVDGGVAGAVRVEVTFEMPVILPFVVPGASEEGTINITSATIMR